MKTKANDTILIIDDDQGVVKMISTFLRRMQIDFDYSFTLNEGLEKIEQSDFDIVLLDVNLPDGDGIDSIPAILDRELPPLVIIMTAYTDPNGAELSIESGAWDYIQKPITSKNLKLHILRALEFQEQKKQATNTLRFHAPDIIGSCVAIQKCLDQASQIVCSDGNVLITGATGTGKELFARAIHNNSARKNGEFIVVDCSLLSENLIESVLFGHEKGSFTNADRTRKGLVALANGGTLFLDELAELPVAIQSSFLRVLQEKKFRPVGSEQEIYSDFRVICATNKDIDQLESENHFRTDLLYRLKTFVLTLPPLKNRLEDILQLTEYHIKKSCKEHNITEKDISPDFIDVLEKYDWPGNIRELINTIETSVTAAQFENRLFAFHLPTNIRAKTARFSVDKSCNQPMAANASVQHNETLCYNEFMDNKEKEYLHSMYASVNGDIQLLMKKTALSRTVLYRKLKKHHIH